jgi:hypothetical protein
MRIAITVGLLALVWVTPIEAQQRSISLAVSDVDSGRPLPARVYLQDDQGRHFFFSSSAGDAGAVRYNKQNWINKAAIERHTTVSAHPCSAVVPPGSYTLTVLHGKTYFPWLKSLEVADGDVVVEAQLKRWADTAAVGWYSGDAHIHRTIDELRNIVLAEDLNVVFPLTNWVTLADTPPSAGDKNIDVDLPDKLIHVDDHHVIWPRNTEYEIFSVAGQRHTLGALFVLGHEGALKQTVPPWQPVVAAATAADPKVLFDMDKLSWPFAMVLPTVAPSATYEIVNNHLWRTEFGFREWYTPTPPYIQPPFGAASGGERDWIDFTLGMYYTLLDCGFRMPPSAGTANGVHPVPAGFGRVYVHLPGGFDYQGWRDGLGQGRSFVTTGPMLFATADGHDPGHVFQFSTAQQSPLEIPLHIEVVSEQPLSFGELVINGLPEHLLRVQNERTEAGAYRSVVDTSILPNRSGWFALRFWEDREDGSRVRFAHSAPWYVELDGEPVKPRHEEKAYLVRRIKDEIERSRGVVSEAAMNEYQRALDAYLALPTADDSETVRQNARPLASQADRDHWLENMILHHRLTPQEIRLATGMSIEEATAVINRVLPVTPQAQAQTPELRVLPYPGGRHPRRGFLDGAIDPERDTKVSIFPPWKDGGYAVVDVPEAIFSNLGLTYLAHQHIPTIWTEQSIELDKLEWKEQGGALVFSRTLPNGIEFGSRVAERGDMAAMEMWLKNGTDEPLTGLRSQVCVMMKGLAGFTSQRRRQQLVRGPFVAVKADDGDRWLITAWSPNKRAWTNPPVPCVHSDPVFPDCPPGETVKVQGGLWFYEGNDIEAELAELKIP